MSRNELLAIARIVEEAAAKIANVLAGAETSSPAKPAGAPTKPAYRPPTKAAVYPVSARGRVSAAGDVCKLHNELLRPGMHGPFCLSCWKEKKQANGEWEERR